MPFAMNSFFFPTFWMGGMGMGGGGGLLNLMLFAGIAVFMLQSMQNLVGGGAEADVGEQEDQLFTEKLD